MNKMTGYFAKAAAFLGLVTALHAADSPAPTAPASSATPANVEKILVVDGTHLLLPIANYSGQQKDKFVTLGIYVDDKLVQSFNISLPQGDEACWIAAYPIDYFRWMGKQIKIASGDAKPLPESYRVAVDRIKMGSANESLSPKDYTQPYRNQFHASTRRGWNNDPNGMVFQNGKYHLYYQHNPVGIFWGNLHWGHLESTDLIHWEEKPIALYQKTLKEMAASGGGFIDFNNSAGLGKDTLFIAATITGRSECLFFSKDGGLTFTELPENPVVKHTGRDPKILWYQPEQKWIMVAFEVDPCEETKNTPQTSGDEKHRNDHMVFFESKNLKDWTRTGVFTDPDRMAVYECPELFELPVAGKPGESRWILMGAQNRYFIGKFDGKTFHSEAGPIGTKHGAFYAGQTFSDVPDGRRIQMGWVQTDNYLKAFPDQIMNQAFSLPHELTLRETPDGLSLFFWPVKETENLRGDLLDDGKDLTPAQANELLQKCNGELTEVVIEFADSALRQLILNGIDASFDGRSARIFNDLTFNEIYADEGLFYAVRKLPAQALTAPESRLTVPDGTLIRSLKIYCLKSIWTK